MFTRRRIHLIIALLLLPLSLRAMLPAGFMAEAGSDGPRIVLCSGGFADLLGHADDSQNPQPASGEECPFAHALLSAPPPQWVAMAVVAPPEFRFLSFTASGLPPATGPPRQSSARAPPAFLL